MMPICTVRVFMQSLRYDLCHTFKGLFFFLWRIYFIMMKYVKLMRYNCLKRVKFIKYNLFKFSIDVFRLKLFFWLYMDSIVNKVLFEFNSIAIRIYTFINLIFIHLSFLSLFDAFLNCRRVNYISTF